MGNLIVACFNFGIIGWAIGLIASGILRGRALAFFVLLAVFNSVLGVMNCYAIIDKLGR